MAPAASSRLDFDALRARMVQRHLRKRGIADAAVLEAMGRVPRERFVPARQQPHAYGDHALVIGEGQTISQPYIVALSTAAAAVRPGDRVLDVGTGSGYQAAVLAAMGAEVYSIERIPALAERAAAVLRALQLEVEVVVGDGSLGWPEHAPYDAIIVAARAPAVPQALIDQLADGGRLVVPAGEGEAQTLWRVTKRGGRIEREALGGVRFVPLIGAAGYDASAAPPESD